MGESSEVKAIFHAFYNDNKQRRLDFHIAAALAQARADALEEAAERLVDIGDATWLRARADKIRDGGA